MTVEFKTSKGKFLAVGVLKFDKYLVSYLQCEPDLVGISGGNVKYITTLPDYCCERTKEGIINKVEIIGLFSKLTEEQKSNVVEEAENEHYKGYKDYHNGASALHSASESFDSLMLSNSVLTSNPLCDEEPKITELNIASQYYASQVLVQSEWFCLQEKVSEEWLLLKLNK